MQAVVIKKFKDKCTGDIHSVGDEIEITEERAAEIMKAGKYIVIPSGQQEEAEPPEAPKEPDEEPKKPEVAPMQQRKRSKKTAS